MDVAQGTPSTQAVEFSQDNSIGLGDEEEFPEGCWGRLVSLTNEHADVLLRGTGETSFGRHASCTVGGSLKRGREGKTTHTSLLQSSRANICR